MMGKIAGPLYGAFLYFTYGRNALLVGMLSVNVIAAACAEITMPPSEDSRASPPASQVWDEAESSSGGESSSDEKSPLVAESSSSLTLRRGAQRP